MKEILISIIVPVYNVKEYLDRTMRCLLRQTYKPLEIILVDDGSTDGCAERCDFYAKHYTGVKVIHQENQGAACARNAGIIEARGAYIGFVDADDLITKDYVDYLYRLIIENDADISICKYEKFYDIEKIRRQRQAFNLVDVWDSKTTLEQLLYRREITAAPWAKLMKADLIKQNKFPEGMLYEDLGVIYLWFGKASRIVYSDAVKYDYLMRKGSSQHSEFNIKKWDLILISEAIVRYIEKEYPEISGAAYNRMFISLIQILRGLPKKQYPKHYRRLITLIKRYRRSLVHDSNARKSTRLFAMISYIHPDLLRYMGKVYDFMMSHFKIVLKY